MTPFEPFTKIRKLTRGSTLLKQMNLLRKLRSITLSKKITTTLEFWERTVHDIEATGLKLENKTLMLLSLFPTQAKFLPTIRLITTQLEDDLLKSKKNRSWTYEKVLSTLRQAALTWDSTRKYVDEKNKDKDKDEDNKEKEPT